MPKETPYTIADLARLTGLNVRTIRYYIAQGLIPASGESGPGAHYGDGHLDRLRLTRRLQQQHLPLSEIRARLAALSDDDVAGLVATASEAAAAAPTSALDYVRSVLAGPAAAATAAPAAPAPPIGNPMVASARAAETMPTVAYPTASTPAPATPAPAMRAPAMRAPAMSAQSIPPPPAPPLAAPPPRGGASLLARFRASPPSAPTEVPPGMPRMHDVSEAASPAATATPDAASSPAAPAESAEAVPTAERGMERSQWERLSLAPNIELHVRRPMSRLEQRRVERLITIARQVLNEDQS